MKNTFKLTKAQILTIRTGDILVFKINNSSRIMADKISIQLNEFLSNHGVDGVGVMVMDKKSEVKVLRKKATKNRSIP